MSKQKLIALTTLACGSMASLFADQPANKGMSNGSSSQQQQQSYVITPSAQPVVEGDADFFFTADFIWWKPNQEGTAVAVPGFANGGNAPQGKVLHPHYKFEPGFKFGVGTTMKHDGWDLYANWTWLRSSSQKSHHNTASDETQWTNMLFSTNGTSTPALATVAEAETRWNMHFNAIDLELGRNFWISKYLTLRPHFGLKTVWNHQNLHTEFEGFNGTAANTMKIAQKQHFWGLGIRTGLDTSWHFDRNWSIYGDFALAALWTDYDNSRKDNNATTSPSVLTFNSKDDLHSIEPVLEIALGLMYQTWWHNDDYQFTIAAGWEEQVFFNHNQNIYISDYRPGNFTLQGLTVKVGFEF